MKKLFLTLTVLLGLLLTGCSTKNDITNGISDETVAKATTSALSVKGADVSWVPAMEYSGYYWLNKAGVKTDILNILKSDYGMNTVRLRVFVNPSGDVGNGWCDTANTVAMAKRAKALQCH